MTSDELRPVIAKAALDAAAYDSLDDPWCRDDFDCSGPVEWDNANDSWRKNGYRIADAVIVALRSAGVVLGVPFTYETTTDEEFDELDGLIDGDPETYEGRMELFTSFGLALVRVIPGEVTT